MPTMHARELIIESREKANPFAIVSPADFQVRPGGAVDPYVVLNQPNVSLYCLDPLNQQALFVETAPDVDVLKAPFYFIAQYEAAIRLISVPYDTLHALAREVEVDPQRIILFYSTGRCGSTLFSHILNLDPSVVSYSEPDVFSQLVMIRTAGQATDEQLGALLRDSVLLMCANAQRQGLRYFAFKFRSYVLSVSDLLFDTIPDARLLFLYRNALTWAYSFSRAFGAPTDEALAQRLEESRFRYMIPSVDTYLKSHGRITWVETVAHMWVSTMQDARRLQMEEAPLACARYEDLKTDTGPIIQMLLTHCGVPMPDPDALAQVLARDSQAGTQGAQDREEPARHLTDSDLLELERVIRRLDSSLAADTILTRTIPKPVMTR